LDKTQQFLQLNLAQTQAQMAAVKARVEDLRAQIGTQRSTLEHLDAVASEQERLQQDVGGAREALQTYRKKEEEARFSNALDESRIVNVAVVEPARVPTAPEPSKSLMILTLGTLMSVLAALGLGFIRDRLDPTVKTSEEARAITGLPALARLAA